MRMLWLNGLKVTARLKATVWTVGCCFILTACGDGEQSRPLNYEKGVYLGQPDTPLSEDTIQKLRERAAYQGRSVAISGGGRDADTLSSQSYPKQPDALRQRVREQGSEREANAR